MASIVDQELAVRSAILAVAPAGTFLRKVDSPGRLYESVTAAEIVAAGGSGGIKHSFGWGDVSSTLIATMPAGVTINAIYSIVTEVFNGIGAEITIGTVADPDLLMGAAEIDLETIGTYLVSPGYKFGADTEIKIFNVPGSGASTGEGSITINF